MKKLIFIMVVLVIAAGCRAKKEQKNVTEVNTKENVIDVKETETEKEKIIIYAPPVVEVQTVKQPCDENGKVKPFSKTINTGRGSVKVFTDEDGNIQLEINLPEVKNVSTATNTKSTENKTREKETDLKKLEYKYVEVVPFRYWVYLVAALAANVLLLILWLRTYFLGRK